jgi:hypothetical protein
MAKAAVWAVCLFPIWGSLLWELWENSVRPLPVPRAEIDALSAAMLVQHANRAEQMAFIEEDRAWRYSESFEQGKWRRVQDNRALASRCALASSARLSLPSAGASIWCPRHASRP